MSTIFNGGVTINGKVYVRALAAPPAPVGCTDDPAPDWAGVGPTSEGTMVVTGGDAPTSTLGKTYTDDIGGVVFAERSFNSAVSTNRDATVAVAGDRNYINAPETDKDGAAFVFTASGSPRNFANVAKLESSTPNNGPGDGLFGATTTISSDGKIIAVWAIGETDPLNPSPVTGAVHIFEDDSAGGDASSWAHRSRLVYQDPNSDSYIGLRYGSSIALTEDGAGILVGVPGANLGTGEVEIWERVLDEWEYTTTIYSSDTPSPASIQFGFSLDISHDGKNAIIGTEGNGVAAQERVYVASSITDISGLTVGVLPKPVGWAAGETRFGHSVAMSGDGSTFVVGHTKYPAAIGNVGGGGFTTYDSATPTLLETVSTVEGTLYASYGYQAYLGFHVCISLTGQVVGATAPLARTGSGSSSSNYHGAGYVYVKGAGPVWTPERRVSVGDPYDYSGTHSFDINDCGTVVTLSTGDNTIQTSTL